MVRVNLVLMMALSLAVVGAAVVLAIGGGDSAAKPAGDGREALLQRLGGRDPDLASEAEREIRAMEEEGIALLRRAAVSEDEALAARAVKLLRRLESMGEGKNPSPSPSAGGPLASERRAEVAIYLQASTGHVLSGESPRFFVHASNGGSVGVGLALERRDGFSRYSRFAWFEIVAPDGTTVRFPAEPWGERMEEAGWRVSWKRLSPGEWVGLYEDGDGTALARPLEEPGLYRIRYVYDARTESAYRRAFGVLHPWVGSAAVPAGLLCSNEVTLTVARPQ